MNLKVPFWRTHQKQGLYKEKRAPSFLGYVGITWVEFIRSIAGLSLKQSSKIIAFLLAIKIDTIPHGIVVAPDFPTHYSQLNFQPDHFRKVIFQLPNNIPSASQTWQLKIPPFWIIVVHCTISAVPPKKGRKQHLPLFW